MTPLRGAVIGLGNVAVHGHVPGWRARADVEIVATADARPEQQDVAAACAPGARWYDSAVALLDCEALDFVDICTPPSSHAELVEAALRRGLHVLCEKPLVLSLDAFTRLAGLAAARGRVLHTVHNWHHAPIVRQAGQLIREGAVGRVRRLVWHTLRRRPAGAGDGPAPSWRVDPAVAGGGVLTDHGWHAAYLLRRWIGQDPTGIRATLETRRHHEWPVEDTAAVELDFPGALAQVWLTWAADVRRNWAEVTGVDGILRLEDDTLVLGRARPGKEKRWSYPCPLSDGSTHPDWFAPVAAGFLGAVTGAAPDRDNLAEAALCVTVGALARESSREGGRTLPVALPALEPARATAQPAARAGCQRSPRRPAADERGP